MKGKSIKRLKKRIVLALRAPKKEAVRATAKKASRKPSQHRKHVSKMVLRNTVVKKVETAEVVKEVDNAPDLTEKTRQVLGGVAFVDYVAKNVGSRANDILGVLATGPETDEKIAEILNLKLNETRRMLNVLNGYGIVRYDINRDKRGWLTFEWYLDGSSLLDFDKGMGSRDSQSRRSLPENCNDFFICGTCYKTQHIVLPFDVAYENSFRCGCGGGLSMLSRSEAEAAVLL